MEVIFIKIMGNLKRVSQSRCALFYLRARVMLKYHDQHVIKYTMSMKLQLNLLNKMYIRCVKYARTTRWEGHQISKLIPYLLTLNEHDLMESYWWNKLIKGQKIKRLGIFNCMSPKPTTNSFNIFKFEAIFSEWKHTNFQKATSEPF